MRTCRGNILFLILLAVVLFAALAYAVTSSLRGGGKDASSEEIEAATSQIVQQATLIEHIVSRLMLTNDCKDTQISFYTANNTDYLNNNAPATNKCHVFDPAGGAGSFPIPPKDLLDSKYSGQSRYGEVLFLSKQIAGPNGMGRQKLTYLVPYISEVACRDINFKLYGLSKTLTPTEDSQTVPQMIGTIFQGTYASSGGDIDGWGAASGAASGFWRFKDKGCTRTSDNATPFYFHILIDR